MPELPHCRRHERRRRQLHRRRAAGARRAARRRPDHAALEPAPPAGAGGRRRRPGRCCSLDDVYDARRVAEQIGIPYYVVNFEQQFEEQVVKPFVDEYLAGRTPDPLHALQQLHQVRPLPRDGRRAWARSRSPPATTRASATTRPPAAISCCAPWTTSKDQTYFLFGLTQAQLARTLFPLGELTKPEVRELARVDGPRGGRQGRQPGDLLRAQRRLRRVHRRLSEGDGRRAGGNPRRDRDHRRPHAGRARRACIISRSASAAVWASPPASRST